MTDTAAAPPWSRLGSMLLDLLFPPRCVGCQRMGTWLCADCLAQVERIPEPVCRHCGRPTRGGGLCPACQGGAFALQQVRAPFAFDGVIQHAVHRLKYRGRRVLAGTLGALLADFLSGMNWPVAAIVPVPLHRQRERARGYNQSALLARVVAAQTGWPLRETGLVRQRDTRPQVGLDGPARQENVRGAFSWTAPLPPPDRVLLLDDVYTTGATMAACATALREAGTIEVRGLALARPR
jgi:ComF family protein